MAPVKSSHTRSAAAAAAAAARCRRPCGTAPWLCLPPASEGQKSGAAQEDEARPAAVHTLSAPHTDSVSPALAAALRRRRPQVLELKLHDAEMPVWFRALLDSPVRRGQHAVCPAAAALRRCRPPS